MAYLSTTADIGCPGGWEQSVPYCCLLAATMKELPLMLLKNIKYKLFSLYYSANVLINSAHTEGNLNFCALWNVCNLVWGGREVLIPLLNSYIFLLII
jgi:hypothetical protein